MLYDNTYIYIYIYIFYLVVVTLLKNIRQMVLSPQVKEQIKRLKPPPNIHMQVERCTCWKPALRHSKKTAKCMTSSCFFCHTQLVLYEVSFLRSWLGRSDMANTWVQTTALKDGNKASKSSDSGVPSHSGVPMHKKLRQLWGSETLRLKCVELGTTTSKLKQRWCRPFQDAKLQVVSIWQPPAIPKTPCWAVFGSCITFGFLGCYTHHFLEAINSSLFSNWRSHLVTLGAWWNWNWSCYHHSVSPYHERELQ